MSINPPEKERKRRLNLVRELMRKEGVDVLLVGSNGQHHHRGYLRYLSYWRTPSWEDYLVFPVDGEMTFFTHYSLRARWAREVFGIPDARSPSVGARHDTYVPFVVEAVKKHKPNAVGLVSTQTLSGEFYVALIRELADMKVFDASHILDDARLVKSPDELELYRKAGEVADLAYKILLESLRPGRKEYEVIADVEHAVKSRGAEEMFYMIGSGPNPELKYNGMLNRTLERGDLVVFTLEIEGPGGYWVELSRAVSLGKPKQSVRNAYRAVVEAEEKAVELLEPQKMVSEVARVILDTIKKSEHNMMGQALGHGAGLDIFEQPLITPDERTAFKPGMVLAVHPHAVTREGAGCIISNNYVVGRNGPERLFRSSSDFEVV